jgi:hypothetical protein
MRMAICIILAVLAMTTSPAWAEEKYQVRDAQGRLEKTLRVDENVAKIHSADGSYQGKLVCDQAGKCRRYDASGRLVGVITRK